MGNCTSSNSISRSAHFHANRTEDSLHVMIKHDLKVAKMKGTKAGTGYVPRAPLSDRLIAAQQNRPIVIKATEDTDADASETDKEIMAALREQ